jgi:5-methylcytosine-specific restriction endonuclease McrA
MSTRGWQWSTVIVPRIRLRDHHTCQLCGRPCPHPKHHDVDHIRRVEDGGTDDETNLRLVCVAYNRGGVCRPLPRGGPTH